MAQTEIKPTQVVFFCERSGRIPIQKWLKSLPKQHENRCRDAIRRLQKFGNRLRHPHVHNLGRGIYELRTRIGRVRYRILYFWHDNTIAILSHGIAKQKSAIPQHEIERALNRKRQFEQDPILHTQEINHAV